MSNFANRVRFTNPMRSALAMAILLGVFAALVALLLPVLLPVFSASPYLNGLIFLVFIFGVVACFWQVFQVSRSTKWLRDYLSQRPSKRIETPRLLAPLAVMMKGNQLPTGMSTASAQSILDSIAIRMDEVRDITRYIINLLIFLGLLGTFYGLATTIPAVLETIRALRVDDAGDAVDAVTSLMTGLENQLGGMGTAFGSSLIGLAGSLMVGLLELIAGHSQNRFYREFEEWLSNFTTVGMAETGMEIAVDPNDDTPLARAFRSLSDSLQTLDRRLADQTQSMLRVEETFGGLRELMQDQKATTADLRAAIRATETQLIRMGEDLSTGREASTLELRRDLVAINQSLREMLDGVGE